MTKLKTGCTHLCHHPRDCAVPGLLRVAFLSVPAALEAGRVSPVSVVLEDVMVVEDATDEAVELKAGVLAAARVVRGFEWARVETEEVVTFPTMGDVWLAGLWTTSGETLSEWVGVYIDSDVRVVD